MYDTDTTINLIRDAIVANYLDYDLINREKHGFDAKKRKGEHFLEVKQCSFTTKIWGGTWNDTNEEKAKAFSDPRLHTAIALWRGASDLQFIVFGQHPDLGIRLLKLVTNRKSGSRSTQSISMLDLIAKYKFKVICPPDKEKGDILNLMIAHDKRFAEYVTKRTIKTIRDI
ncbi:MAG TPA: hypothetical protein PLF50_07145 [Candidatus Cloacimonadota bacterium]|nr:hypothetical protein [Candidatus Cloacimonadota bacterium]